jgi:general secretion pathway protein K
MVLTAIAIFTAIVVDFAYSSRVELDLAANARDEVRAYFMARSAVNMSRLILHFQKQLDSNPLLSGGGMGNLTSMLAGLTGKPPAAGAAATPPAGGGGGGMSIRLWELIPIDSGTIQMFLGGAGLTGPGDDFDKKGDLKPLDTSSKPAGPGFGEGGAAAGKDGMAIPAGKGKVQAFGDFSGSFHADVDDESKKFNVAWLDNLGRVMQIAITRGLLMFGDKRYEWLYDEEDAHHVRVTARDLLVNIHDFIDADATASVLNPTDTVAPFAAGFSDELQGYSRYKPQYKPKNAPMDSLDELYLVDGISDRWMAAFRDRVTVFPDKNKAINVNTDDPFMQLINIYVAAANPNDPMLQNPLVIQQILHDIQVSKLFAGMGMTVPQFIGILASNKVVVNPAYAAPNSPNSPFADKSDTFTIHATGEVGRVQKKLTVVVKTDSNLGQLLYWREE